MTDSLIWRALVNRRIVFALCVSAGLATLPILLTIFRPSYQADSHLMLVSESTSRDPLVKGKDVPVLALSYEVLSRVRKQTGLDDSVKAMRQHLAVKNSGETSNMLTLSYRAHDPATATKVANAVADQTVAYYGRLSTQQYDRLGAYLRAQISAQRDAIERLDREVERAASADSFVSTDKAVDTITTRLDDLQGKLGDSIATLTADQAASSAAAIQPQESAGIMRDQQLLSDPLYQNLRNTQARDAAQLSAIKSQYTGLYPGLPSLDAQVQQETQKLDQRRRSVLADGLSSSPMYAQTILDHRKAVALVAGDEARVAQYKKQIAEQQRRLSDLSSTGISVAVLRTERDTAMASYQALSAQLSTVLSNQAEANSLGALVVVDRASDTSSQFESFVLRALIGVIAVLVIALMVAVIVEVVDPRLRLPSDVERLYGRPNIATIAR
jgi:uncharacterized protein involved in exopolysaccharide biosynthesis